MKPAVIFLAIAAVLCLLAVVPFRFPYGYFTILRWAVTVGTVAALMTWPRAWWWGYVALVPIVILFNPLAPVHLSRQTWRVIDSGAGVVLAGAAAVLAHRAWKRATT